MITHLISPYSVLMTGSLQYTVKQEHEWDLYLKN